MKSTAIRVALLTGALITGTAAQGDPSVELQRVKASLLEHMSGEPAAAVAELETLLETAEGRDRQEPLSQLVFLHRMLGQGESARARLEELAGSEGRFAAWARDQLRALAPPQDPDAAVQDREIPRELRDLVQRLGSEPFAEGELRKLGSLVIPAVVKALDDWVLDLAGTRAALRLIAPYEDERVTSVMRDMLQAEDPLLQVAAAEQLPKIPDAALEQLAPLALDSGASIVRLRGVQALLRDGMDQSDEQLRGVLEDLVGDQSAQVRAELAELLRPVPGADADRWLEELARDEDHDVYGAAILSWRGRRTAQESERRIALFESLPRKNAAWLLELVLQDGRFVDDAFLVRAAGFPEYFSRILKKVGDNALAAAPDFLRAVLASDAPGRALQVIQDRRLEDLLPEVADLLDSRDQSQRLRAFEVIAALRPEQLLENASELLRDRALYVPTVSLLAEHGGTDDVPAMVEAVRAWSPDVVFFSSPTATQGFDARPLLRAIATHSDASHLDALLDLVTVPSPDPKIDWGLLESTVQQALRRWLGPETVGAALRRVRTVDSEVAETILELSAQHAGSGDMPLVIDLLEDLRHEGLDPRDPPASERSLRSASSLKLARRAVEVLGARGGAGAESVLRALLPDPALGHRALDALLSMDGADREGVLAGVLAAPDLRLLVPAALDQREVAENEELRGAAEAVLLGWDSELDPMPWDWLGRLPREEARRVSIALVERLREDPEVPANLLLHALEQLSLDAEEVPVDTLALGLKHADSDVRSLAVTALGQSFTKEAAVHLIEALKDRDELIVAEAQHALERLSTYFAEKEKWEKALGIKKDG